MPTSRRARAAILITAALVAAAPALAPPPAAGQAAPGGSPRDGDSGIAAIDPGAEMLKAAGGDVTGALQNLDASVRAEVDALTQARTEQANAKAAVDAANAAVSETKTRITELTAQSDQVVVDAFVNPPTASALDALAAGSTADATIKQSILTRQSDADADVLTQLEQAQAELETERATRDEAVRAAHDRAGEAANALDDVVAAQSRETLFVTTLQERIAANLSEAESLARLDPAAAEALRAREGEIAAQINDVVARRQQREAEAALAQAMQEAAARAAAANAAAARSSSSSRSSGGSGGGSSVAGAARSGLSDVSCPGGGSITVASSIAGSLSSLLNAASAAGIDMCGGGYRDPAEQVALRRAHCGSSYYAIYEAPSSACSPPTAPPGTSMHEQGLAVDFTVGGRTIGRGTAAYSWMQSHAASYGFYNLPAEAWHWSTTGN
jgi:D-alanyl-D-alanine carboxypeptidase